MKKNNPLRLDINYLVKQSPGTHKEFDFEFSRLDFSPDLTLEDISGKIAVSVTEDGVVVEGELKAQTNLECSRCLEDYDQHLDIQFTEIFSAHLAKNAESELDEQPLPADGSLDLGPIIRDYAILDIPIRQICKPECKGLCQVCGCNLNVEDCGHRREEIDPRLEGLKQLLDQEAE